MGANQHARAVQRLLLLDHRLRQHDPEPRRLQLTDDHDSYDACANGPSSCSAASTSLVGASYRQERFDGHGGWGSLFNKDGTPTGPMDPDPVGPEFDPRRG